MPFCRRKKFRLPRRMLTRSYVQIFADQLNSKRMSNLKSTAVLRRFLNLSSQPDVEAMRDVCKEVGLFSNKKKTKGRFMPSQWYEIGNARPEGTKNYRRPQQYAHFYASVLKDHTVFKLVDGRIELHPRLRGLALRGSTFVVLEQDRKRACVAKPPAAERRPQKRRRVSEVVRVVDVKPNAFGDFDTDSDAEHEEIVFFV